MWCFSLYNYLTFLNAEYSLFCFCFSFLIGMLFIFYLEVLPRTSGEGDQDVKNCLHQPATVVTDFNKDAQMIDHRLLHLFGGQINCYQNPYNGYTPPLSFHFLTPNGNLIFSIITFILSILICLNTFTFY